VPKQTPNLPTIAGLTIAGLLTLLFIVINFPDRVDAGIGLIVILVSGFVQATAAVAALVLLDNQ
jgi:uncharacterized protein DUF5336